MPPRSPSASYFTAEHIFPWMCEEYGALRPIRAAADILAHASGRACTTRTPARQRGPGRGDIYVNDLYVERAFAEETAARSGPAAVGHQRVRAQRPARRRRADPRAAHRPGARPGVKSVPRNMTGLSVALMVTGALLLVAEAHVASYGLLGVAGVLALGARRHAGDQRAPAAASLLGLVSSALPVAVAAWALMVVAGRKALAMRRPAPQERRRRMRPGRRRATRRRRSAT